MTAFLIILHVFVCIVLIIFVLLQPGARGGVGAAFGGAGGQTVFGGRGANTFLAKLTAASAVIFMITCISLSYFVTHSESVMKTRAKAAATSKTDEPAKAATDAAPASQKASGDAVPAEKAAPEKAPAPAEAPKAP